MIENRLEGDELVPEPFDSADDRGDRLEGEEPRLDRARDSIDGEAPGAGGEAVAREEAAEELPGAPLEEETSDEAAGDGDSGEIPVGEIPVGSGPETRPIAQRESAEDAVEPAALPPQELRRAVEAVLFSQGTPITIRALSELLGAGVHEIREVVEELRYEYIDQARAFRIEDIAGGVQILTQRAYDPWIRKLRRKERESRLSGAALETLAVIAYKQPIGKADLEAIRGVNCSPILKTLLDRCLIQVVGRSDALGRPLLYGTTRRFLESFGIGSVRELPQPEGELRVAETTAASGGGDRDAPRRLFAAQPSGVPALDGDSGEGSLAAELEREESARQGLAQGGPVAPASGASPESEDDSPAVRRGGVDLPIHEDSARSEP